MNSVRLFGCLAREVQAYTQSPTPRAEATLTGVHFSPKGPALPWYVRVAVFGEAAQEFARLTAGSLIQVYGGLHYTEFPGTEPGSRKSQLKIHVREFYPMPAQADLIKRESHGFTFHGGINEVHITARLGKPPEFSLSGPQNIPLLELRLAVHEQKKTHWVNATCWGDAAQHLSTTPLQPGQHVDLQGRLRDHRNKNQTQSTLKIDFEELQVLSKHPFISGTSQIQMAHD